MKNISQPAFFNLSESDRKSALESLIFSSEEPLSSRQIINMLVNIELSVPDIDTSNEEVNIDDYIEVELNDNSNLSEEYFDSLIEDINKDLALTARPYRIHKIAGGWQFGILQEYGQVIHRHFKTKVKKKLSQAALETLAIIAYKQPVSKPEIEQIRGVNSNEVVNSLIEKNIIKIAGRSEALGKPLLFATTQEFLRTFGINSLDDLPKLKELEEISPLKPESELFDSEDIKLNAIEKQNAEVSDEILYENEISDNEIQDIDDEIPIIEKKPEYI